MPFPGGASTITLTGTLTVPVGGTASAGKVVLTPSARLVDATNNRIYAGGGTITLDGNGAFTTTLLRTDSAGVAPTGWRWHVDEQPTGGPRATYWIELTAAMGATVDLADVAAVSSPDGGSLGGPPSGPAGGALTGSYPNPALSSATIATFAASSDPRLSDARTPTAHAATHAAAGNDPVTLTQAQITGLVTALADKAPLAGATFTGAVTVNNADLSVLGTGKGYRFRRGGGALDLEATGADLLISNWSGPAFDGTQRSYDRYSADAMNVQHAGKREFVSALYGVTRHVIDGTANQTGWYGASPVGRQTVTGSRGGNAALESLLTALANLGWITDNTTA